MPLTLRRRPRIPAVDAAVVSPSPGVDRHDPPLALEPQPAALVEAKPIERKAKTVRRIRRDTWRDRMLGEIFFFLIGLGVWLSNAVFTVLGVTAPVGLNLLTGLLGFGFHVLLSRAELYLWHRWHDPWYLLVLVGCVLLDAGTTLVGLLPLAATWVPWLVGGTPVNVLDWSELLVVLVSNTTPPAWWPNALVLMAIAFAFALGSERILRKFHRGMVETWHERPA